MAKEIKKPANRKELLKVVREINQEFRGGKGVGPKPKPKK